MKLYRLVCIKLTFDWLYKAVISLNTQARWLGESSGPGNALVCQLSRYCCSFLLSTGLQVGIVHTSSLYSSGLLNTTRLLILDTVNTYSSHLKTNFIVIKPFYTSQPTKPYVSRKKNNQLYSCGQFSNFEFQFLHN